MTVTDGEITQLLRAGVSDRQIGIQLRTDAKRVSRLRAGLGLPKAKSGVRRAERVEDLFYTRAEPLDGGHLRWTGYVNNTGNPALRYGGRHLSAYRIAFQIHTGREPIGHTSPGCDMPGGVAPAHMDDQAARSRNRAAYHALFGGLQ